MRLPLSIVLLAAVDICGNKPADPNDTADSSDTASHEQCSGDEPGVDGTLTGAPGSTLNIFGTHLGGMDARVVFTTSGGKKTVAPTMGDDESIAVVIPADAVAGDLTITNGDHCSVKVAFTPG